MVEIVMNDPLKAEPGRGQPASPAAMSPLSQRATIDVLRAVADFDRQQQTRPTTHPYGLLTSPHWQEAARLDALRRLNLLDTPPDEGFDRITRLAAQLFGLPLAAVSLTDRDRQWFKSRVGVAPASVPREMAACALVAETNTFLVVPDLLLDPRFDSSPLAQSGVRFYAGAALTTDDGFGLGALCVLGMAPRQILPSEIRALHDLASLVMSQIAWQRPPLCDVCDAAPAAT
jgi:hypothetical protein